MPKSPQRKAHTPTLCVAPGSIIEHIVPFVPPPPPTASVGLAGLYSRYCTVCTGHGGDNVGYSLSFETSIEELKFSQTELLVVANPSGLRLIH